MPLAVVSTLPPETELVIQRTIGCAIEVHRTLGPGYLESIYAQAMEIELQAAHLAFERERPIVVQYKHHRLAGQRVDFIVEGQLIVEIKAVARLDPLFQAKLISYLRTTGLRAGLLMNFNSLLLKDGLNRIVV
ncbi:MAG: GxxExxY protein [Vicinamibacterales bacterium]